MKPGLPKKKAIFELIEKRKQALETPKPKKVEVKEEVKVEEPVIEEEPIMEEPIKEEKPKKKKKKKKK
jgi:hypothetical protein